MTDMQHWPFRVVWGRARGWLAVEDPWTDTWHQVWAKDAPRHWVRMAMESRDPRRIAAEKNERYRGVRNNEIDGLKRLSGYPR